MLIAGSEERRRVAAGQVADGFAERWNFNNCIGALDGKHILIRPPAGTGSYYFNYKHSFSIVLLALVDADYKFIYVDIGTNGRISDGGVFKKSDLGKALEENTLSLPTPVSLPGGTVPLPYVVVADDAFPLKTNVMKPFSMRGLTRDQRIYNYRHSRSRRIVENAFGILANRFRVFMTPMALMPEVVEDVVEACLSLHNFLRRRSSSRLVYTPPGLMDVEDQGTHEVVPGNWRQEQEPQGWAPLAKQGGNNCAMEPKAIRMELCRYFNSAQGQVPWQWDLS